MQGKEEENGNRRFLIARTCCDIIYKSYVIFLTVYIILTVKILAFGQKICNLNKYLNILIPKLFRKDVT